MPYNPQQHQRRSIRLPGYDYTQPGAYFVTICVWQRECLFGAVEAGVLHLNAAGQIAHAQWLRLSKRFPYAAFSEFVVMPNHVHGIIEIRDTPRTGTAANGCTGAAVNRMSSPSNQPAAPLRVQPGSLGAIVRAYKSAVSCRLNARRGCTRPPVWQRNYYEHIIRDAGDWQRIVDYIHANPARWTQDQLYPP